MKTILALSALLLVTQLAQAQGGLAVQVVSANVLPNPQPGYPHDYKEPNVLQLEVIGTDRSGAYSITPRDKDIALYDCNGEVAARYLYFLGGSTHRFRENDPRTEIECQLIFSIPKSLNQQFLLKWAVARYTQTQTAFVWTRTDRPLTPPLAREQDGVTMSVDAMELGHLAKAEIDEMHENPETAAKLAADHLIMKISYAGLLLDAANTIRIASLEISTAADGHVEPRRDPSLDIAMTHGEMSDLNPAPGSLHHTVWRTTCHFLDTVKMPEMTKLMITVSREIPFDEGWAPVTVGN